MPRKPDGAALLAGLFLAAFLGVGAYFACVDQAPPAPLVVIARYEGAPVFAPAPRYADGLIDLNRADWTVLDTLPGIGETIAARIVDARPFYYLEDLLQVRGIGDKRFADIRPLVAVYGAEDEEP